MGNEIQKEDQNLKQEPIRRSYSRNTVIVLVVVVLLAIVALIGTTYALFTSNQKGTEQNIVAGTLTTTFTEGNVINLTNAYPLTDSQGQALTAYTFTIKNTGTIAAKYNVTFEPNAANTLSTAKIKYIIQQGTNAYSAPALLSTIAGGDTFFSNQILAAGASVTYNLKLWIDNVAGNEVQGQSFKAKVVVDLAQG